MQYRDKPAVPVISYSAATLVGISRLTEQKHWASDVFAGALIGYLCGRQVVSHYNRIHQKSANYSVCDTDRKTEITFVQSGNQVGLFILW
jgi:membrane-associated phospholipid phosphatase